MNCFVHKLPISDDVILKRFFILYHFDIFEFQKKNNSEGYSVDTFTKTTTKKHIIEKLLVLMLILRNSQVFSMPYFQFIKLERAQGEVSNNKVCMWTTLQIS